MSDRLGQWTCHICARKVAAGVMCVHGPHTKHQPTLPPAIAPPETGYTTDDWLAEADDLIQFHEGEGHETAFVDRDEYKTMKALRQIVTTLRADVARLTEQVREWRAEAEAAGDRARAECALRREVEAERDAVPVGEQERPMIEVGDWVNSEPIDVVPDIVLSIHEWKGMTLVGTITGGSYPIDSIREVRKADGRIWRRDAD